LKRELAIELAVLHKKTLAATRFATLPLRIRVRIYSILVTSDAYRVFIRHNREGLVTGFLVVKNVANSNLISKLNLSEKLLIALTALAHPYIWISQSLESHFLNSDEGIYIEVLCVDSIFRSTGIASGLLMEAINFATVRNQNLFVATKRNNRKARNLYKKFGLIELSRLHSSILYQFTIRNLH
jgi:ribosomal protein S18 acetylase RimI-like enzyme